jgi:hypothetical protein
LSDLHLRSEANSTAPRRSLQFSRSFSEKRQPSDCGGKATWPQAPPEQALETLSDRFGQHEVDAGDISIGRLKLDEANPTGSAACMQRSGCLGRRLAESAMRALQ